MDVTANSVTAAQLEDYATRAYGTDRMNQDQWCFVMNAITGAVCPAYDVGNPPSVNTSAQDFLDGLRSYQLGVNAQLQGPGGSSVPAAALSSMTAAQTGGTTQAPALGAGLFGPTNCQFCIWLKNNPWAIFAALIAVYFAFFYKK